MTPSDVITDVRFLIQDEETPYRYSDERLLGLINQILKRMVAYRPDLFIVNDTIATTPDTVLQNLPEGAVRLMEIYSVTDGDALKEVNRETLDQMYPGWVSEAPSDPVNWMRHPRNPTKFFLYPRPDTGVTLEAEYINSPEDLALSDDIELPEAYKSAVVDGTVYLAESIDSEAVGNGRAQFFLNAFFDTLGVDLSTRSMVDGEDGRVNAPVNRQRQQRGQDNG